MSDQHDWMDIRLRDDGQHEVLRLFRVGLGGFLVEEGDTTDFASIPPPLRWAFQQDSWRRIAVGHDRYWREMAPQNPRLYRHADWWLYYSLRLKGMGWLKANMVLAAVRLGALSKGRVARRGVYRDLPRVLGVAAVSVPLLLLPTLGVVAGGLILGIIDGAIELVARAVGRFKAWRHR